MKRVLTALLCLLSQHVLAQTVGFANELASGYLELSCQPHQVAIQKLAPFQSISGSPDIVFPELAQSTKQVDCQVKYIGIDADSKKIKSMKLGSLTLEISKSNYGYSAFGTNYHLSAIKPEDNFLVQSQQSDQLVPLRAKLKLSLKNDSLIFTLSKVYSEE